MPKSGIAAVGLFGSRLLINKALERGVFLSAGLGKDRVTGQTHTHFHVTTWDGRFDPKHYPVITAELPEETE